MARVNVRCWQETYRGLMSDAVLDDPGFLVAEPDGELVGIALSGPFAGGPRPSRPERRSGPAPEGRSRWSTLVRHQGLEPRTR
jgi:hypothetical protein